MFKIIKDFLKFTKIQQTKDIIFYSEGSHDTIYYKNIIKILEEKYNLNILILTSQKKDIAFKLNSNLTHIIYIGDGLFRTVSFMLVKTKILAMSVPDLDNFFLKKNKLNTTKYIYIFHSVSSTNAAYYKNAFNNYDYIFCRGPHQKNEIIENENMNSLFKKKLIEHGCPIFDKFAEKKLILQKKKIQNILIAPSWNKKDELIEKDFLLVLILKLLDLNMSVTLRLHPMTQRRKVNRIKYILSRLQNYKNFNYSTKMENKNILNEHDLLITDWSGISWEFSLMLGKITFFIDTNKKIMNSDYHRFKNKAVEIELRDKIGYLVKNYDANELITKINSKNLYNDFFNTKLKNIYFYRDKMFYNKWKSSEIAANEINKIITNE